MATRTIKTKLEISGDKEYKDKLKSVNAELAEQKSEMKLLSEQYKSSQNSQEALTKKIEQLKQVQASQNKVLEATKKGTENAYKEYEKYSGIINVLREKIEKAQIEQENINKSTESGKKRYEELSKEINDYNIQLEDATKRHRMASAGLDDWETKQSKAKAAINKTQAQLVEYNGYLDEAKKSTDNCAKSIDQYGKRVKQAAAEHKEFDGRLDSSEAAIGSLAAALTATGMTKTAKEIADVLYECVEAAGEFETALAKVETIADTSAVSMDAIKGKIIELSNATGQGVSELSEATYNAISAGVETAGSVEFVSTATKLATGGFTDNTTAVDILTTVLNAYNMELSQAGEVSDYLITTQNLGKTTVNELASSMGKVIPVAATYNVEMDNLSSAMAILTSKGIATAESTTYMKAALNELGDSGSDVSKLLVEETGMSFASLMKQGKSLGDVMEILGKSVGNDKGAFNELWKSSEAGIAALSILSTGSKKYNEVLGQMKQSAGATADAYEKMANTTDLSQKKMSNAFKNLKIAVGSELQDQLSIVYEKGTDLLIWSSEFIEKNEWVIPVIEGLALGLGVAAVAITGYTFATEIAIPIIISFYNALSANPIGLVTTAVIGLVAVLSPLILETANAKTEIELETEAINEQAEALRSSVDAYSEQGKEQKKQTDSIRELKDELVELAAKEHKTEADKKAIAEITERLNKEIPNLALNYDELTGTLNLTNEQMDKFIDKLELQDKYNAAKDNYSKVYAERKKSIEKLEEVQKKLNDATNTYNELQLRIESGENVPSFAIVNEALEEVNVLTEQCEILSGAVAEADSSLSAMTYDMNMYVIESANMTDAERESIDAMMEAAEVKHGYLPLYYEEIDAIAQTAKEYDNYANEVKAKTEAVEERLRQIYETYNESYTEAYNSISGQIGLFKEMKTEVSISISDMMKSLDSQVEYMGNYADNMKKAMELGVSEGLLKQLSDGSAESAGILQEIVNSGEEKIQELNEKFSLVSEGKEEFAEVMAELETTYNVNLDSLIEDTQNAVENMAKYDEAYQAAQKTCDGIIAGLNSKWDQIMAMYNALNFTGESVQINYSQQQNASTQQKVERGVVSNTSNGIVNNVRQTFNINQPVKSPSELMRAARLEQQYGLAGER